MLSELDSRWNIIEASIDDRTEEERGLKVYMHACVSFVKELPYQAFV